MSENLKTLPGAAEMSEHSGTAPLGVSEDDEFSRTMVLDTAAVDSPEPDEVLQPGSVLRDRYLIQERIAGGSMGVVYKAVDRHLDDAQGGEAAVAIKVLSPQLAGNPDALRALQQEAAKGRCLSHPNIVRFIDLDREDTLYFLVMEWLEGESLADALDGGNLQPDLDRALDIVRQIGTALTYAHQRGVVHADVKPGNIMLLPDGSAKLVDFGIARIRQQSAGQGNAPAVLKAATPAYSSMQVLTGDEPTPADDVFSLACLAYRLIAGHRVFGPRNAAEAAQAGMEPQPLANLSDTQWKALRKGLAFARVARQKTPLDLVEGLLPGTARASQQRDNRPAPEAAPADAAPALDDSLRIPREAIIERRFETRTTRWPYLLVVLVIAAGAVLMWRPDWRNAGIDYLQLQLERLQEEADRAAPAVPAAGEADTEPVAATTSSAVPAATTPETRTEATPANEPAVTQAAAEPPPQEVPGAAVSSGPEAAADEPQESGIAASDPLSGSDSPMSQDQPSGNNDTAPVPAPVTSDASLVLAAPGGTPPQLLLQLREDGEPITIELLRWFGLGEPLLVRVDEIGFSGSRSPGDDGQYQLSNDGVVNFDAGQRVASITVSPVNDALREPDLQASLLLRDYYSAPTELGRIDLRLLDDDQREFEAGLPVNAVAFATDRILVRERDPAAQIDVVRFNPDQSALSVSYEVRDETATEGEDYFAPGRRFVSFGPGQRNARVLVPLVQDNRVEGNESFVIELNGDADSNTIRRIAVMIRDDDNATD